MDGDDVAEEPEGAAGLEGMAAGIRQLAVDIANAVIENAFDIDIGRMRELEAARKNAGRLEKMIGELIRLAGEEIHQE